jgi:geranylgeranyl pyrophosphate synthase
MKQASYIIDALKFRSARRELVVDKIFNFSSQFAIRNERNKKEILLAIEYIHTSASIVDDIQDYETIRKNELTYYKRHGYGTSAFAALKLWTNAIQLLSKNYDIEIVLYYLQKLISCQEIDVGLSSQYNSLPEDYFEVSSKKISYELEFLYYLSMPEEKFELDNDKVDLLIEIGKLIQFIDDKFDEFVNFENTLSDKDDVFKFQLSLPFILANTHSNFNKDFFFKDFSKNEALEIFKRYIDNALIEEAIDKVINEQEHLIENLILHSKYNIRELEELFNTVRSLNYISKNTANETFI